jgi:alpha-D-ribose 1-methylphosphonate 5-triphosphate synthase subunit PhnH
VSAAAGLAPLDPDTAQRTFRAVLDALARPGVVQQLPVEPEVPTALLPVLALADLDTSVAVLADDGGWAEAVTTATTAPITGLPTARLVAALRTFAAGEPGAIRTGSAAAPEDGALVALAVPAVDGGTPITLRGPGIANARTVAPQGLPADLLAARAAATFPAGFDLLLADPGGRVLGIPRSTRISTPIETRIEKEA